MDREIDRHLAMDSEVDLKALPSRRRKEPMPVGTRVVPDITHQFANVNEWMVDEMNQQPATITRITYEKINWEHNARGHSYQLRFDNEDQMTPEANQRKWEWSDYMLVPLVEKKAKPDLPDI